VIVQTLLRYVNYQFAEKRLRHEFAKLLITERVKREFL
jgi:hypothetical protein